MREHLEVVNLSAAIDYVEEWATSSQEFSEDKIKTLHQFICEKVAEDKSEVGHYRHVPVAMRCSEHQRTSPSLIEEEMAHLIDWSHQFREQLHPIEYAAALHEKVVAIAPFFQSNGKIARLLMNAALLQKGYPSIIIKATEESKSTYYQTLELAHLTGNLAPFSAFITSLIDKKLEAMLELSEIIEATDNSRER